MSVNRVSEKRQTELSKELDNWICSCCFPGKLIKDYPFKNFVDALGFVNEVGAVAEQINHHPSIQLEWGRVHLEIWTHAVGGLTEFDFALAKEIDKL